MGRRIVFVFAILISFAGPTKGCDIAEVTSCLRILSQATQVSIDKDGLSTIPNVDHLKSLCGSFSAFKTCYKPKATACQDDVVFMTTFGTIENTIDYLCVEAFEDIIKYASCWNQTEVTSDTTNCHATQAAMIQGLQARSSQINQTVTRSQWCQILETTSDCMTTAVNNRCGPEPSCIMRRMMSRALRGLTGVLKCTAQKDCPIDSNTGIVATDLPFDNSNDTMAEQTTSDNAPLPQPEQDNIHNGNEVPSMLKLSIWMSLSVLIVALETWIY